MLLINTINYWNIFDDKLYFLLFDFCYENDLKFFINELYKTCDIPVIKDFLYIYHLRHIEEGIPFYSDKLKEWILKNHIKDEYDKLKLFHTLVKNKHNKLKLFDLLINKILP